MPAPLIRTRPQPRISVNKLGEYAAEHKAGRRLAILKAQKQELRCRVIQYQAAKHAIISSLQDRENAEAVLSARLQRLREWSPGPDDTDFDERENRLCREAIQSFMEMLATIDLAGLTATRGDNKAPKLVKSGVEISVCPELVLRGTTRRGVPVVGAVKLHFPKTNPLSTIAAEYVGTILNEFGEMHLAGPEPCAYKHCYVIDVSSKQMYVAPASQARRRSDIEAACREIAGLWDTVPIDQ